VDLVYSAAKALFAPGLAWGLCWTTEGEQHVPRSGPVILASNHISYLDPLTLAWVADARGRRVRFLAKDSLFATPGLGPLLRSARQIPVHRGARDAAGALDDALGALDGGACVAVFPEGTISLDLDPMPAKTGTARLAAASGVPVVPVGLWGSHRIAHKGRRLNPEPLVAQVAVVGAPIQITLDDDVHLASDRIMDAICGCVRRARALYPQQPRAGDDWWWREPDTAQLRSCIDPSQRRAEGSS
jgi:1-acyl-sn-glycerol-3-phosphate acyltransferase